MKREKTSKARYFTVRLNPTESNPLDADTLAIIERLMAKGFGFKSIVQDAILRADGATPEMYSRFTSGLNLLDIQSLFEKFAAEILSEVKRSGGSVRRVESQFSDDEIDDADVSPFAARFAKSFLDRQRQTKIDED